MTKGLEKLLNIRSLDEEHGIDFDEDEADEMIQQSVVNINERVSQASLLEGTDHAEAMDGLHDETVKHARDLMEYGHNIDMPRQRGIFEIAAAMYGHAISAKNSKRDEQIKSLRLALDRRKVDLEEKRTNHVIGQQQSATVEGNTIVVEDRNELLKRLREQIKNATV